MMFLKTFIRFSPLVGLLMMHAIANGQCRVEVSHTPAQQLSLADVDFQHFQGNTLLFTIFIPGPVGPPDPTLTIDVSVKFANGSSVSNAVHYVSQPFSVTASGRTITNLNLGRNGDIKTNIFDFDEGVKQRLQDASLGTGNFPAGVYTFNFNISQTSCQQPPPFYLVLENNTRIELRSPRDGETTGSFPMFEFYYDGDRTELIVGEKNPDQSRDDAIAHVPPMLDVDLGAQNSFIYSGGRPLEDGKTYVWRVIGKVRGENGQDIDVPSQIGMFTVSNSEGSSLNDILLSQLEEIFGKRYPGIFQQIHQQGFTFTGNNTLDGTIATPADLMNLLNQLREQSDSAELGFE
jgi:hypothetical protein